MLHLVVKEERAIKGHVFFTTVVAFCKRRSAEFGNVTKFMALETSGHTNSRLILINIKGRSEIMPDWSFRINKIEIGQ